MNVVNEGRIMLNGQALVTSGLNNSPNRMDMVVEVRGLSWTSLEVFFLYCYLNSVISHTIIIVAYCSLSLGSNLSHCSGR